MAGNQVITLNEAAQRFELTVDGATAFAAFVRFPGGINYNHTVVPPALEGRGIGSALVRHALDYARAEHLRVQPDCSFVRAYIERHPAYQDLL